MAETERSFAELQSLLADNTTEQISAQDLRDAVVSALGGYASLLADTASAGQALTATPVKLTAFTAVGAQRGATASSADDEITVPVAGDYRASFSASLTCAPTSLIDFELRLAGAKVTGGTTRVSAGSTSVTASFVMTAAAALGQKFSVFAWATPDATVTVRHAQLVVKRAG